MDSDIIYTIIAILIPVIVIAAWITALVLAIKMVRGGGRPEKLWLIGICLMVANSLISIATPLLMPLMAANVNTLADQMVMVQLLGAVGIINGLLSLAGIVLMVIAFWKKFKSSEPAAASGKK